MQTSFKQERFPNLVSTRTCTMTGCKKFATYSTRQWMLLQHGENARYSSRGALLVHLHAHTCMYNVHVDWEILASGKNYLT